MSHFENKRLLFGLMAGAAGVTFVLCWYLKTQKRSKGMHLPVFPNSASGFDLIDFPYETHQEEKTVLLLQGRQLQILEKLNGLVVSVEELKRELTFLKEAIPKLDELVRDELQGKTESRRTSPSHRSAKKRKTEAAAPGVSDTTSSEETESEGGYMTAHTDTEGESEEEKGLINSSVSSLTPEEKIDLSNLLQEVDRMHAGSEHEKRESFKLLLEREEEYRNHPGFLWRLVRAYGDMFDLTTDAEEKKNYAAEGKLVGENAIHLDPSSAESHQCQCMRYFIMTLNTQKNTLNDFFSTFPFFLLGFPKVAQLSWIEKKVAAALFGTPPTSTIHEALQNFLKAEEIHPRYSKCNYVYLAKCYKDLGQRSNALSCCERALSILPVTKEDQEAEKVLETLLPSLKL
ncbi:regulator of microtubule dynamics protein 2 [Pseudonaja textilis]|uniref:regulator of microtubule dynamics protein 2 n=1 Tax=Pseudonaja textilis TaxID=8673 RepID=UPI000EA8AB1D|nr:regulator of microtubule dynamics protein 2 [Pseudonaja textilis]